MDNSVYQARWLLAPIFILCFSVFGIGVVFMLFYPITKAIEARMSAELEQRRVSATASAPPPVAGAVPDPC